MNGWKRVPKTLTAECRVQDYLRRPLRPAPWCRVLRVARMIELYVEQHPDCQYADALPGPWWAWDDVYNPAVTLVNRRRMERARAPRPPSWERFTHELTPDGLREIAST